MSSEASLGYLSMSANVTPQDLLHFTKGARLMVLVALGTLVKL